MLEQNLQIGAIFSKNDDDRIYRIIGLDETEVSYDYLWGDNRWMFSGNFKKRVHFYNMKSSIFEKHFRITWILPITTEELRFFRPDLPLKFGQTDTLNWNGLGEKTYIEFIKKNDSKLVKDLFEQHLPIGKLVIVPYGSKRGLKKGVVIEADESSYFTVGEIIWKANQIQYEANKDISNGIGVYRLGFEKGIPSYYLSDFNNDGYF